MRLNILMPIMTFMTRYYHSSYPPERLNYGSNHLLKILYLKLIVLIVLVVSSCEEDPTKIGSEMLPSDDFVSVTSTDTLSVWSYTMYNNTVETNNPSFSFIGSVYDPYFGSTFSEFVTQIRLSSVWNFGPVTVDSVKLNLRLLNVKEGSGGTDHFLTISEISEQIYEDSVYYSTTTTETTGYQVTAQLPVLRTDTINAISILLPVEFGEYLLRDTSQFFYSTSVPDFRSYFKGLILETSYSFDDPLLINFNLETDYSTGGSSNSFVIFMHDTANVARRYYFFLDPLHKNACYHMVSRDFSTAYPDKMIPHINDLNHRDSLSYLQYMNGVYTKIVFPGLDSLKTILSSGKFSINKARLIVPAYLDGDIYNISTIPRSLRLRFEDKNGIKYNVPDYILDTGHKFFDGNLDTTNISYNFNIPSYIQLYLEDKSGELKPELEIFQDPISTRNVILRANDNKFPVKFELTYTRF